MAFCWFVDNKFVQGARTSIPSYSEVIFPRDSVTRPSDPKRKYGIFSLLLSPCCAALTCHHLHLFGPLGWDLSFSCSAPALWLLFATHSRLFDPLVCCLSSSCSSPALWLGLAPFLRHHSRLSGPLGWRPSFSCSSPCFAVAFTCYHSHLLVKDSSFSRSYPWVRCGFCLPTCVLFGPSGWCQSFSLSCSCLVVAFVRHRSHRADLAHWAAAFLSPALPLLYRGLTCHHLRLFGQLGWLQTCQFSRLMFCPVVWCPSSFFGVLPLFCACVFCLSCVLGRAAS